MTSTLVCGWFSIEGGEATAGDLLAMELARDVAAELGPVTIATNAGFAEGLDLEEAARGDYDVVLFVCGPLYGQAVLDLVERFPRARKIAADVSVVDERVADAFDVVLARDGGEQTRPDMALGAPPPQLPVIGVVRAHEQPEYRTGRHVECHDALRMLLASRPCAVMDFDTRIHPSADPVAAHGRSPGEVLAMMGRMDAIVTTRLHGLVLGLSQRTPVLAVDPIPEGGKVSQQAVALDWPAIHSSDDLELEPLAESLTWCLSDRARDRAGQVADRSTQLLAPTRERLRAAIGSL